MDGETLRCAYVCRTVMDSVNLLRGMHVRRYKKKKKRLHVRVCPLRLLYTMTVDYIEVS